MASIEKSLVAFSLVYISSLFWPMLPNLTLMITVAAMCILFALFTHKTNSTYKLPIVAMLLGFIWACSVGYWYSLWQLPNDYINTNVIIEGYVDTTFVAKLPSPITSKSELSKFATIEQNDMPRVKNNSNTQVYGSTFVTRRFSLRVSKLGKRELIRPIKVALSWYAPTLEFQQGNKVRLLVSLLPPHGLLNIDGHSIQKSLASKHVGVIGKVRESPSNRILDSTITFRQSLINNLQTYKSEQERWILALALGERSSLNSEDWRVLQESGTAHLFAISGMHLGIVSGFVFLLTKRGLLLLQSLKPKISALWLNRLRSQASTVYVNNRQANLFRWALLFSLPFCLLYADISGFQVPVRRALIAFSVFVLLTFYGFHWRLRSLIALLIFTFIIIAPLSLLSLSFWFSFTAVLLLCFWVWRFPLSGKTSGESPAFASPSSNSAQQSSLKNDHAENSWFKKYLKLDWLQKLKQLFLLQVFLSLAMLPLVASQFGIVSLVSPFINILILPIVTLILLPLSLVLLLALAIELDSIASLLIDSLSIICSWTFNAINSVLSADLTSVELPPLSPYFWIVLGILAFLIAVPAWPRRQLSMCISVVLLINLLSRDIFQHSPLQLGLARLIPQDKVKSTSPSVSHMQNKWTVTIVDIGQGLSIILERDGRRVVYDSGPRFSTYPSTAQRVFPAYGNMPIDMLINSHYDNDHAGGNAFILGNYHVGQLFGPDQGCNREQQELIGSEWQNLKIEVLWPLVPMSGEDNNHSCVLRINDGVHTWLLTGDIEAEVESALLKHYVENVTGGKNKLKADFLIAPHHGSKTSSSEIFISAVRPTHVFIGSKYYNHWGFPHEDPFENYKKVGAEVHNTAYDGAIKMTLLPNKFGHTNSYKIETMRGRWTSPWYMKVRVPSTKPQ